MSENEYKEFMDLEEVKDYLGVSISTVYRYIRSKENPLPSFKITGSTIRVRKSELDVWLENYRRTIKGTEKEGARLALKKLNKERESK